MAAKDYEIVTGCFNAYLAKKKSKESNKMSHDRRVITTNEIYGLFEWALRNWCMDHEGEYTMVISNGDGKKLFEATLLDKDAKEELETT